jgi:hypothetical protein
MATTTPNFGWSVPTSTDLVKDGATAIETLGDSIDASLVDLKGGTTGQVLAKASGTDMDFTWSAASVGKIKQVIFGETVTGGSNSSTTYADTTLTATITPTSASNDIYVFVAHTQCYVPSNKFLNLRLVRASTTLRTYENQLNNSAGSFTGGVTFNHKDSPATTSATTYKTQFASTGSGGTVEVQVNGNYSTIVLMEVEA